MKQYDVHLVSGTVRRVETDVLPTKSDEFWFVQLLIEDLDKKVGTYNKGPQARINLDNVCMIVEM